ncbi:hypothetical protein MMC22_002649, partial [Lobaria immixta]|nr:hypothetical protein [Lobaria immixta]
MRITRPSRSTKILKTLAVERGWKLLVTAPFQALRDQPLSTLKQCALVIINARVSNNSFIRDRGVDARDELYLKCRYLMQSMIQECRAQYFPRHSPHFVENAERRRANDEFRFPAPLQGPLDSNVIGQPVLLAMNGVKGHSVVIAERENYCRMNPHIHIYIAVSMPKDELKNAPPGVWSWPSCEAFPNSRWSRYDINKLLDVAAGIVYDVGYEHRLKQWEMAGGSRKKIGAEMGPDGPQTQRNAIWPYQGEDWLAGKKLVLVGVRKIRLPCMAEEDIVSATS